MTKAEARGLYLQKRKSITTSQRARAEDLILINFQKLSLPPLQYLLTYAALSHHGEIDTDSIVRFLHFRNPELVVCYPKTNVFQNTMQAIATNDDTLFEENKWRLPEPVGGEEIPASLLDIVLVPLLAFDKTGHRVGYGKGFYDRFFPETSSHCLKLGLCLEEAIDKIDDAAPWDVHLNYCITPQKIYEF